MWPVFHCAENKKRKILKKENLKVILSISRGKSMIQTMYKIVFWIDNQLFKMFDRQFW